MRSIALALGLCALAAGGERPAAFRTGTNLTLVNASVVDRHDRFVADLKANDFRIFEQGTEEPIKSFAVEDTPISIAVVLDASKSMKSKIPLAVEAVAEFLQTANPEDEFSVVTVRDRPEINLEFVRDPEDVVNRMRAVTARGSTALIDSVYLAASHLKSASHERKALLVISDGDDNHSRYREADLLRMLRECDCTLYAVGVGIPGPPQYTPDDNKPRTGADLLGELADASGGRYFEADTAGDLPKIMRRIDIRYQYVLGFAPDPAKADGKYHHLDLKLSREAKGRHLQAYWRPGYYAPLTQ